MLRKIVLVSAWNWHSTENGWLENEVSFWDGLFSGVILVWGRVLILFYCKVYWLSDLVVSSCTRWLGQHSWKDGNQHMMMFFLDPPSLPLANNSGIITCLRLGIVHQNRDWSHCYWDRVKILNHTLRQFNMEITSDGLGISYSRVLF